MIVIHKTSCTNLKKTQSERLISVSWAEILDRAEDKPDEDFYQLDELDFSILQHHRQMGVDYSLMVASILSIEPRQAFERHRKLGSLRLLRRVEKVMIQYRKNIVHNKWIKHRNHTYYQITSKGERYLNFFASQKEKKT
jgi:predicted transcriptional regulator